MGKIKRPLVVISEFQPFGLQLVGQSPEANGDRHEKGVAPAEVDDNVRGSGDYYLFPADTARVRGGFEYNSVMSGWWDHDQELYIFKNKVIWSGGQEVHKQFSAPTAVLQAKWCRVDRKREPLLCILHSDCLMTYSPAGEMHSVPLQFSVGSIWAIPNGLLLQRTTEIPLVSTGSCTTPVKDSPLSTIRESSRDGPFFGVGSRSSPFSHSSPFRRASFSSAAPPSPVASILALLHPLEEPQAVLITEGARRRPMADMEEQLIWSSCEIPYLVSYHNGKKHHSIWEIEFVSPKGESFSLSKSQPTTTPHAWEESGTFCLRRVWQEKCALQASQVFLATDEDGVPILCVVVKEYQRLSAFRLSRRKVSEELRPLDEAGLKLAWSLEAISAAPIIALHPRRKDNQHFDLLVLSPDGNLSLHTGSHHMCSFFFPVRAAKLACHGAVASQQERTLDLQVSSSDQGGEAVLLLRIQDVVADRFNILTSSGKVYRCGLNLPFSSGVTASCIAAFAEGLRPVLYRYLLKHFLERDCAASEALFLPTPDGKPDVNWAGFSDLILEIVRDMPLSRRPKPPVRASESMTPWDFLLQSSMHKNHLLSCRFLALPLFQKPLLIDHLPQPGFSVSPGNDSEEMAAYTSLMMEILEVLHAVYEDCKLDTIRWRQACQLARLLSHLAAAAGELEYVDHYTRDFPTYVPPLPELSKIVLNTVGRKPPALFQWIMKSIKRENPSCDAAGLPPLLRKEGAMCVEWSRKVIGFYELLNGSEEAGKTLPTGYVAISRGTASQPEHRMVLAMVAENFSLPDLDRLPCGVSLPMRHALDRCREAPPGDWPPQAYILVGREDLASTRIACFNENKDPQRKVKGSATDTFKNPLVDDKDAFLAAPYMLHLQPITMTPYVDPHEMRESEGQGTGGLEGSLCDGMDHMNTTTAPLRFCLDLRLNEVRRLLGSSKPVAVRTANSPDISDPDIVAQQHAQLWQLAQRTTSLPFGRGAYTLATSYPLLTETLPIPKLVLAGRLPSQHDATVNLDVNSGNITDITSWPEFHNGAAAGLRLAPGQGKITRTWIVYNKPDEPSFSHAGFLMSLGLHKHLGVLAATDVYRYLSQEHEATTVGVLLGMAAARRGTMDPSISKILYLHIPARHPPSFPELELPTLMQSAALMAVGLLYEGSAHRLTTEILLAEIGRKPGGDNALDREGYALAAGLALGLVTLGRGNDAWGLADLHIEDRLRHYISGGSDFSDDRQRRLDGHVWTNFMPSATRNLEDMSLTGGQVMEGSMVNLDVTAPGATLALALMFLKTNNKVVAARLAVPSTHFALEYVRPDFILLRLVAKNLILWDSIQPTEEWVQAQVPDIVKEAVNSISQPGHSEAPPADADMEALAQAHVNILAGACLSIALRYAGTAKPNAQKLIRKYAIYFLKERRASALAGGSVSPLRRNSYVDRGTLETCLNVAVLSLSVVMAGTGHLETFRLLRYLRRRSDLDGAINYGNHMAVSMAIGFLFLGGGLRTFGTNNGAVAALLVALYPRFPTSANDHRCHLQAFRHLYVLATEARCVRTIDVDTGLPVVVPLEMTVKESDSPGETVVTQVTPCILPERCSLMRVRVSGPRYWPQDIRLPLTDQAWWQPGEAGDPFNGGTLYVKRRVGARSYADDPIGCRSLLSRAFQKDCERGRFEARGLTGNSLHLSKVDQLVSTFSGDPSMLAFAQLLRNFSQNSKGATEFEDFCLMALFECVSTDRPALLQTYLTLYTTVEDLANHGAGRGGSVNSIRSNSLTLYSLKVALTYCEALGEEEGIRARGESLVQRNFLAALAKRVDDVLVFGKFSGTDASGSPNAFLAALVKYLQAAQWPSVSRTDTWGRGDQDALIHKMLLACYLCWYDIPSSRVVRSAVRHLHQILPDIGTYTSSNSNRLLPLLSLVLPGTPTPGLLRINSCLPFLTHDLI